MASKHARDLGIERIGRSTRYLAVGSLVAGGLLTAAVAKALPGHSGHPSTASPTTAPATGSQSQGTLPSSSSQSSSDGLNAPVQAPQPSYSAPVVSSGGS